MTWLLLLLELIILFFLSGFLTQSLFRCFFLLFRSKPVAISITTLLLFPGTVVHELSHLFTAEILGVHTGQLTLVPENIEEDQIRTGSVAVAQSGPFRRACIGLSPLVTGLFTITALSYILSQYWGEFFGVSSLQPLFYDHGNIVIPLVLYLLFTISNSMFPSSVDMKGVWQLGITVFTFIAAAVIAGFRITLSGQSRLIFESIGNALAQSLGIVLAINIALLLTIQLLIVLTGKIVKMNH